jgi:single-strand DNA-binding protein
MSLNRTTIIGYLEQDPQLRFTPLGNPVCTLSVATDESYTNKETGERKEGVEWHRVLRTIFHAPINHAVSKEHK